MTARRVAVIAAIACGSLVIAGAGASTAAVASQPEAGAWVKPLARYAVTQGFGCTSVRIEPVDRSCGGGHWHSGIDLAAARGTPVVAAVAGVAAVFVSATGYGLHIVIDSGGGLTTLYGHLAAVTVSTGEYVVAGERIGAVGSTGNSTGPHLHFEVRRDGIAEDPRQDVVLP
jgi:murein DD-endopeptidase MepM/ murein hydrolase activator NlpD